MSHNHNHNRNTQWYPHQPQQGQGQQQGYRRNGGDGRQPQQRGPGQPQGPTPNSNAGVNVPPMNYHWQPHHQPHQTQHQPQSLGGGTSVHGHVMPPANSNDALQSSSAQRLLAVYPPASATPVHHISRHIGGMSMGNAPIFPQPDFYNMNLDTSISSSSSYNANPPPPPYSEYDNELRYLASHSPQGGGGGTGGGGADDSGFWENTRDEAVRLLSEQVQVGAGG
ncbi:hypothetical protein CVT26_012924 [Gymnopilus dilepis]|uniref:Uncharacterized protein n=1 Tax=Gymnopilus dilepis TaxID=231916 RepID=A0A409Y4A6_9AGAR|nr:hypothetical protein CVT26_012924 [Gymnopilus dilepis]